MPWHSSDVLGLRRLFGTLKSLIVLEQKSTTERACKLVGDV